MSEWTPNLVMKVDLGTTAEFLPFVDLGSTVDRKSDVCKFTKMVAYEIVGFDTREIDGSDDRVSHESLHHETCIKMIALADQS